MKVLSPDFPRVSNTGNDALHTINHVFHDPQMLRQLSYYKRTVSISKKENKIHNLARTGQITFVIIECECFYT